MNVYLYVAAEAPVPVFEVVQVGLVRVAAAAGGGYREQSRGEPY